MEFLFVGMLVLLPLAFTVIGLSLIVNAIQSVKDTREQYKRKGN